MEPTFYQKDDSGPKKLLAGTNRAGISSNQPNSQKKKRVAYRPVDMHKELNAVSELPIGNSPKGELS
jgi:hypothetical protein